MTTSNILVKEIQLKNASKKLFQMNLRVVAQSNLPIFFQEPKLLKWKELDHKKNADHSMDYIKILNASQPTTRDRSSVSDLEKEKKEPAKLCKKLLSKMAAHQRITNKLMELKNDLNVLKLKFEKD